MSEDLEQFRKKIESYNQDQLEEVLVTLNKLKFPDKFEVVKEVLAQTTGRGLKEDQLKTDSRSSEEADKESDNVVREQEASSVKSYDYSKHVVSSVKKKSISDPKQAAGLKSSPVLVVLAVLTSLIAVYVMLQTSIPLPGKPFITKLANKISGRNLEKPKKIPAPVNSASTETKP